MMIPDSINAVLAKTLKAELQRKELVIEQQRDALDAVLARAEKCLPTRTVELTGREVEYLLIGLDELVPGVVKTAEAFRDLKAKLLKAQESAWQGFGENK